MNHSARFFSPAESTADTPTPLSSIGEESSAPCEQTLSESVGAVLPDTLTSAGREAAIKLAGDLVVKYMTFARADSAHYALWRGKADRARLSMEALIKGRSADWKRPQDERGFA